MDVPVIPPYYFMRNSRTKWFMRGALPSQRPIRRLGPKCEARMTAQSLRRDSSRAAARTTDESWCRELTVCGFEAPGCCADYGACRCEAGSIRWTRRTPCTLQFRITGNASCGGCDCCVRTLPF
jgi:hypothetical protein